MLPGRIFGHNVLVKSEQVPRGGDFGGADSTSMHQCPHRRPPERDERRSGLPGFPRLTGAGQESGWSSEGKAAGSAATATPISTRPTPEQESDPLH
jgi:hypothetical protein